MADFHYYEPSQGHGLHHDPFNAIVGPRPIGWIASKDAKGHVNLAPYSFFNAISDRPPMVMFSSGGTKDSLRNILANGEFTCSIASQALTDATMQEALTPIVLVAAFFLLRPLVVRGTCPHDCPDTCALRVTVRDGVAIKVQGDPDHPPTHGALCTKVSRYAERTHHPERVLRPMAGSAWGYRKRARLSVRWVAKKGTVKQASDLENFSLFSTAAVPDFVTKVALAGFGPLPPKRRAP